MKQNAQISQYPETKALIAKAREQASACDVIELNSEVNRRESLTETFCEEIDQWARRALAANGFGDY